MVIETKPPEKREDLIKEEAKVVTKEERAVPEYSSVSKTKAVRYPSEAKPTLRREIVKR